MGKFDKTSAQELRERSWAFEDFQEYFKQEGKKWTNSSQFKAVISALDAYSKLRRQEITPESAIQVVNANDALMKACDEYKKHKENQGMQKKNGLSEGERQRIAVMDKLGEFQTAMHLDEARDMRVVRSMAGKTWEEAGPFKVTEAVLDGRAQVVGANISQRIMLEVNGKKGFFTEQNRISVDREAHFENLVGQSKDNGRKALLWQNKRIFFDMTDDPDAMPRSLPDELESQIAYNLAAAVDQMAPDDPRREAMNLDIKMIKEFFEQVQEKGVAITEKRDFLNTFCQEKGVKTPEKAEKLRQYADFIMELPVPQTGKKVPEYQFMFARQKIFAERRELLKADQELLKGQKEGKEAPEKSQEALKKNQERREQLEALFNDSQALHELCQAAAKTASEAVAMSHGFYQRTFEDGYEIKTAEKNIELSSLNIATSRVAEMIGLGHLVAHSEKMVVKSGDQVMTGCFMEFAKGVDPTSKDPHVLQQLSQVEFSRTASFTRDMAGLEVLDILCDQQDRHNKNMFYQLSEPDEHGKRNIIGLQGIDNDLAFGVTEKNEKDWEFIQHTRWEKNTIFIDKDVADKIRKLDDAALDCALGDLLNENQMKAMKDRVHHFQDHLDHFMVELKEDEWDLNEYKKDTPTEGLDHRAAQYVKGLKSIDSFLDPWGERWNHKFADAQDIVENAKKVFEEQNKVYEGLENLFAEPEPQKQAQAEAKVPEKQAEAKVPEKQAEAKVPQKQTPPLPARRKVNLGQFEPQTPRAPMIGKGRSVPVKANTAQQEKKAENPQRVQSGFQKFSGVKPTAGQRKSLIGNHQNQAERKQEKGRSMG